MFMNICFFLSGAIICVFSIASSNAQCPCNSYDLCAPVTKQYSKELVVFLPGTLTSESWKKWNWTEITTVILMGNFEQSKELYCYAHSRNVRVTALVTLSNTDFTKLYQAEFRHQIMWGWIDLVKKYGFDGINLDLEGQALNHSIIQGITNLTRDTNNILKYINPASTLSFDVPSTPYVGGREYDYAALANHTDYLIVMDYDMVPDGYYASANSPINYILKYYLLYIQKLSISPSNLVMAVPWYGYDFTCSKFCNETGSDLCAVERGKNEQPSYATIMKEFPQNIDGLKWDRTYASPFFTTNTSGTYHQYWFDNIQSLQIKYNLAAILQLRGLSMFHAACLDYASADPNVIQATNAMWNTITEYTLKMKQQGSSESNFQYQCYHSNLDYIDCN